MPSGSHLIINEIDESDEELRTLATSTYNAIIYFFIVILLLPLLFQSEI